MVHHRMRGRRRTLLENWDKVHRTQSWAHWQYCSLCEYEKAVWPTAAASWSLSNSGVQPRHVLSALRHSGRCLATARDISNLNQKRRRSYLQDRTPLEALLNDLATRNVYHRHYQGEDMSLQHLVFANSHSLDMMRDFSSNKILLMDFTYKTNRWVWWYIFLFKGVHVLILISFLSFE